MQIQKQLIAGLSRIAFALIWLFSSVQAFAQCPMCKASAESNLREGGTFALGLNDGIIYLFLMPYTIIAVIATMWWYNYRYLPKKHAQAGEQAGIEL